MIKKIKEMILSLGVFSLLAVPVMVPAVASADIATDLCTGSNLKTDTGSSPSCDADNGKIDDILALVINIFSIVVGFIAVIMIIVGGIKYITSGGDSGNISGAKNTIVYAIIGLVIVALAQVLVHFVLNKVSTAGSTS